MAKLSTDHIQEIRTKIRALLARNPNISARQVAETLNHDKTFIAKQINKIRRENAANIEASSLFKEIYNLQITAVEINKFLWNLIDDPKVKIKDKISAVRTILFGQNVLIEKKINSGVLAKSRDDENPIFSILKGIKDRKGKEKEKAMEDLIDRCPNCSQYDDMSDEELVRLAEEKGFTNIDYKAFGVEPKNSQDDKS